MASFPDPAWFLALGRLMEAEGESFRRLGYAEVHFAIRVLDDDGERVERTIGLEFEGYALVRAAALTDLTTFDPDFVICARRKVWTRMLDEIVRNGRPDLRGTLSSLALVGEELWLESSDQLREDKFYRVNQTLQEFFNLAAKLRD
ncbi:MAG: hypothetical protein ACLQBA_16245 [Candidatus Binataceae bacterium]